MIVVKEITCSCVPHHDGDSFWTYVLPVCIGAVFEFLDVVTSSISGAVNDNGVWRTRYNRELYTLCDEPDAVKVVKMGRLRWQCIENRRTGSLQKAHST